MVAQRGVRIIFQKLSSKPAAAVSQFWHIVCKAIALHPLRLPFQRNIMKAPINSVYKTLCLSAALLLAAGAHAQNEEDALRFSMLNPTGTARSIGFGSALGSVGGDFSTLSVNPAGIGVYRRGEVMFTPSLVFNKVGSQYSGQSEDDNGTSFSFSNAGAIFTHTPKGQNYNTSAWKAVSFGIGITRMADFSRNYTYSGVNHENSASWIFEYDANNGNVNAEGSPAWLGYQSYLLDTAAGGFISVVDPAAYSGGITQSNVVKERGGLSELALSVGGNYQEKLMLGATLGIPIVRFARTKAFTEEAVGNPYQDFKNFTYTEELLTTGTGVNLKVGAIYIPTPSIRLGLALHTPSYIALTDQSNNSVTANTDQFAGIVTARAPENIYEYSMTTPWRAVLSGTGFIGKYGFLTLDYEFVDYSSARYKFGSDNRNYEQAINQNIRDSYQAASNIRVGGEARLENLGIRAGFGYYGNPYKSTQYKDGQRLELSAGVGYRFAGGMFMDFAFRHRWYKNPDVPYVLPYNNVGTVPTADLNTAQNTAALTLGWKF